MSVIREIQRQLQGGITMLEFTSEDNNGMLTATQLAKMTGESYRTIDFYSMQGLLRVSGRRGRIRLYEEKDTIIRLRKIRKLQNSGYPLNLIKESLDKSNAGN
jgi:DNA-binding transcriptional MerR regulator